VSHGHILVDGRRLDVPSATIRPGQVIEASPAARNFILVRESLEVTPDPPPYLERDKDLVRGTLVRAPARDEIPLPVEVDERLIVELMS
jgi:small subunit ribosomal protein S4